jgi:hypothetical protein
VPGEGSARLKHRLTRAMSALALGAGSPRGPGLGRLAVALAARRTGGGFPAARRRPLSRPLRPVSRMSSQHDPEDFISHVRNASDSCIKSSREIKSSRSCSGHESRRSGNPGIPGSRAGSWPGHAGISGPRWRWKVMVGCQRNQQPFGILFDRCSGGVRKPSGRFDVGWRPRSGRRVAAWVRIGEALAAAARLALVQLAGTAPSR